MVRIWIPSRFGRNTWRTLKGHGAGTSGPGILVLWQDSPDCDIVDQDPTNQTRPLTLGFPGG